MGHGTGLCGTGDRFVSGITEVIPDTNLSPVPHKPVPYLDF